MELSYVEISRDDADLGKKGAGNDRSYRNTEFPKPIIPATKPKQELFANPCRRHVSFWFKDPVALISEQYIIPTKNMTLNQKLNTVVRLAVILALTSHFLSGLSRSIFYVVLLAMIATIFIYYSPTMKAKIHPPILIQSERVTETIVTAIQKNDTLANKPELSHTDVNLVAADLQMPPQIVKAALANGTPADAPSQVPVESKNSDITMDEIFNIPKNYEWDKSEKHPYDQRLFCGIDDAYTEESQDQRELLLSYSDMLDAEFEHELTKDFYSPEAKWWRDQGSFLVDRDIYHPKNSDLVFE